MRIGIDISQVAYERTGVAKSVIKLVDQLTLVDTQNEYVLFFSSLRLKPPSSLSTVFSRKNVTLRTFKMPQSLLRLMWNSAHMIPIETFLGKLDVFISSDWTEPPAKARKITFIHDLTLYLFPQEIDKSIVSTQKKKLSWSKKECEAFICPSQATKRDAIKFLELPPNKVKVIAWGA